MAPGSGEASEFTRTRMSLLTDSAILFTAAGFPLRLLSVRRISLESDEARLSRARTVGWGHSLATTTSRSKRPGMDSASFRIDAAVSASPGGLPAAQTPTENERSAGSAPPRAASFLVTDAAPAVRIYGYLRYYRYIVAKGQVLR